MFKSILVPLDGSKLSEASLGAAVTLATRFDSSVVLLHIVEEDAPSEVHNETHLTTADEAEGYLAEVARRAFPSAVKVEQHVHTAPASDIAIGIVEHAASEFNTDLIITSTHGRGGMRDVLFGSIAQQVVALGMVPVLLIRPEHPEFQIKKILVPLDPDSGHDAALEPAAVLSATLQASLDLLSVVPTISTLPGEEAATGNLLPSASAAVLELREEEARSHLQQHVDLLRKEAIDVAATVLRGDPVAQILKFATRAGSDLIVLSTHRKRGLGAFWSKSVAPRIAQSTKMPLFLLPLE